MNIQEYLHESYNILNTIEQFTWCTTPTHGGKYHM